MDTFSSKGTEVALQHTFCLPSSLPVLSFLLHQFPLFLNFPYIFLFFPFLLMFEYSCLHFLITTFPHPTHTHLSPSIPPCLGSVHGSLIHVNLHPFPFFPMLFPFPLPSGHCQFVVDFNVSGYIWLASLFC